jgi:hypothetical protein
LIDRAETAITGLRQNPVKKEPKAHAGRAGADGPLRHTSATFLSLPQYTICCLLNRDFFIVSRPAKTLN